MIVLNNYAKESIIENGGNPDTQPFVIDYGAGKHSNSYAKPKTSHPVSLGVEIMGIG